MKIVVRCRLRIAGLPRRLYGASRFLFDLAAAHGVAIAANHPFVDGNKRVALAILYVFLERNGYRLEAPETEAVDVMIRLAAGELDERGLSAWLKEHSIKKERERS